MNTLIMFKKALQYEPKEKVATRIKSEGTKENRYRYMVMNIIEVTTIRKNTTFLANSLVKLPTDHVFIPDRHHDQSLKDPVKLIRK